jgi:hypothetical protein
LLASGASQVSGTPIVVTSKGQLVNNPGATGILAIPLVILLITVPVFWALFVTRQVRSWRRATGERRAELKWLMAGGVITVIGLAGTFLFAQFSGPLVSVLDSVMLAVGVFSLPAGISIGILKYRLYDIDRIISRTLAYATVTGLLIGVYAGVMLLATRVLPFHTPVAVAGATLLAAALFSPLRRRVQHGVDRRSASSAIPSTPKTAAGDASRKRRPVTSDVTGACPPAGCASPTEADAMPGPFRERYRPARHPWAQSSPFSNQLTAMNEATNATSIAMSRPSSVVLTGTALLSTSRIRRITATSPTMMKGCAARRWARSDSTTVCTISTRISTSRIWSSRAAAEAAMGTEWRRLRTKSSSPATTKNAASPMSTTPTATVTASWACSSSQIDPATPRGRPDSAAGSSAGSGMRAPFTQSSRAGAG